MDPERSLYDQAYQVLARALDADGLERQSLIEEALRLHRVARVEGLKDDPANLLAPEEPNGDFDLGN